MYSNVQRRLLISISNSHRPSIPPSLSIPSSCASRIVRESACHDSTILDSAFNQTHFKNSSCTRSTLVLAAPKLRLSSSAASENRSVRVWQLQANSNSIILRSAGVRYWTEYAQILRSRQVNSGESCLPAPRSVHHWTYCSANVGPYIAV